MATTLSLLGKPDCQFCIAVLSSSLLRKVRGKERPTANHSARSCQSRCMLTCCGSLTWKTQNYEPPARYFPTISLQLHHTKWPCAWESHVDVLAEIWKLLVASGSDWSGGDWNEWRFHWCSRLDCLDTACNSNPKKQPKTISKTAGDFSTHLQKLKLQISTSFFWINLEIYKTSLLTRFLSSTTRFQITNHWSTPWALGPLEDQVWPPRFQMHWLNSAKFTPLPWPMS